MYDAFRIIWETLFSPMKRARERMHILARRHSEYSANVHQIETLLKFYKAQLKEIDPHTLWWEFAQFKELIADHEDMLIVAKKKAYDCFCELQQSENEYCTARFDVIGEQNMQKKFSNG